MDYEWDEAKNASNKLKHGIGFEEIHDFDWNMAVGLETQSFEGEARDLWVGPIGDKLCSLVITDRRQVVRIISLREADNGEKREWQNEFQR